MNTRSLINNIKFLSLIKREQRISHSLDRLGRNFCQSEQFKERMVVEKRRAERLEYSTSIIVFNLINSQNNDYDYFENTVLKLLKIICSKIRTTDLVSIYEANKILMLLPDTGNQGAQNLCERLMQDIVKKFHDTDFVSKNLAIEILSYPEKMIEPKPSGRQRQKEARVIPMPRGVEETHSFQPSSKQMFKMNYIENLNLSVGVYNCPSLAVPMIDIFFWDQELLSKFSLKIQTGIKRVIDILGAVIGLALFSPAVLLISLLVKITSAGPVFFKQQRVGYRGDNFTFVKFRSMYTNNDDHSHQDYMKKLIQGEGAKINNGNEDDPLYKIANDPRITPVGRFLRKTSLDELPQLWNVLKGDMSLVGPRPPIPYEVKEYHNWHYRRVLEVKPGITGLWQVSGRNKTTFDEMVRLDIFYTANWSLKLDFQILFKTIKAVFRAEGT